MNWILGDNINTDLITPGRYNTTTDPKELAKIAFIEYRPEFAKNVKKGDFIIAGNNFGCGSSRETAVVAIQTSGISILIAKSFARIFYRNCINQGLLAITADTTNIDPDDKLKINFKKSLLINVTKNKKTKVTIPNLMIPLHKEGGIIPYLEKHGLESISTLFKI